MYNLNKTKMRKLTISGILCLLVSIMGCAQNKTDSPESDLVKEAITNFAKATETNNTKQLDKYLDQNYRIVMNQAFGSKEVAVISKEIYLGKIKSKEWGGEKRTVTISNININGNTASVNVLFEGEKMTFNSTIILVKDINSKWKLVSDIPVIQ